VEAIIGTAAAPITEVYMAVDFPATFNWAMYDAIASLEKPFSPKN
jgi:hypothetical protein